MKTLRNIHPGEILLEEFLIPKNITAYRLAHDIGLPQTRISEIIKGNPRITAETAILLVIILAIRQSSGVDCKMTMTLRKKLPERKWNSNQ